MARPIAFLKGRTRVVLDNGIQDAFDRSVRSLLGPVIDVLESEAEAVMNNAIAKWPKRKTPLTPYATGRSAKAFALRLAVRVNGIQRGDPVSETGVTDAYIEAQIFNNAKSKSGRRAGEFFYAGAIRSLAAGSGRPARVRSADVPGGYATMAGKKPWVVFVRRPLTKRAKAIRTQIIIAVRRALDGGGA